MALRGFSKKIDLSLLFPALFLSVMGLLSVYSSSVVRGDFFDFKKQILFLAVALIALFLINLFDFKIFKANSHLVLVVYFFSLLLLLGVLIFGIEIRGIKGWYRIGPLAFDPVPLAGLSLIVVLAKYFSFRHIELSSLKPILLSAVYLILPLFFIFLQPDVGSSLSLIAVWFGIVVFSGIKLKHFFILCLVFILLFAFSWLFLFQDYQKERIASFFNPEIDARGVSWSLNQSKIAIGSAGFFGKGLGQGSQTQYGFLSEPKTDFIFSALTEEFGLLAGFLLLLCLFLLLWRVLTIAFLSDNNFCRLFASGFAVLVLAQSFINIGMCLGLFPVVGIPLPFVSYGGSHLLAFYIGLGLLMNLKPVKT